MDIQVASVSWHNSKGYMYLKVKFSSLQSLSHVWLFETPWTAAHQASSLFTQTHVHWVGDTIQPSHPLSSPSPPDSIFPSIRVCFFFFFLRVCSSHQVAKVLEFQLQHQSFQWRLRTDLLQDGLVGSPCRPRDSQESYPIPQFKSINSSALSFLYSPTHTSIHDHLKDHSFA